MPKRGVSFVHLQRISHERDLMLDQCIQHTRNSD
jgi:hypothetical protein